MIAEFSYLYNLKNKKDKKSKVPEKFIDFVTDTHFRMMGEEFVVKPFHHDICNLLTKCAHRKLDNKYLVIINMPPRYSKTQIMTYYVMWCFLQNERAKFIYTTYSNKLTLRTSREIKNGLVNIFKQKNTLSRDAAELWETNAGGGFWATTMLGAVTGFGAGDLYATPFSGDLIIDDPQKISDSFYETKRNTVIENFSQTFWSRRNNADKVPIIVVQQRTNVDDLSGWLINKSGYRYERYVLKAIDEQGESTFPERVSKETLQELKQASPFTFYAQQQQEPQQFTGNFFLIDRTQIMTVEEFKQIEWLMKFWVRSWDFAGVKKETRPSDKNDYTRGVLMCTDGEFVYIVDVATHRGTVDGNDVILTRTAHSDGWKVTITVPEDPGSAGQHYVDYLQHLKELAGYTLHPIRPTHNKQLRAAPFASFLNQGRVKIVGDENDIEKWNHILLEEMASFPFGEHDDIIDACSDAFHEIHAINKYV